uniref:Uncharacterized protein n=1 Tax=viral metagenome TaxID=1070528 RepID=A0A6M3XN03_9ZZZZ
MTLVPRCKAKSPELPHLRCDELVRLVSTNEPVVILKFKVGYETKIMSHKPMKVAEDRLCYYHHKKEIGLFNYHGGREVNKR